MTSLSTYLKHNKTRQLDFANSIGVKQATISRLVNGSMRPSLELAVLIERETGGAVPARSWIVHPRPQTLEGDAA